MSELPESVQEIADVIGRDKALNLVFNLPKSGKRKWRRNIYVPLPMNLNDKCLLVRILGFDDAKKVSDVFGGLTLQPANCAEFREEVRNKEIVRLFKDGVDANDLSDFFGLSDRRVFYILKEKGALKPEKKRVSAKTTEGGYKHATPNSQMDLTL